MKYKLYFIKSHGCERKLILESDKLHDVLLKLLQYDNFEYYCWQKYKSYCVVLGYEAEKFCPRHYVVVNNDFSKLYDITNYFELDRDF